jgi:PhoPQ-activated pathogenicity-related protein
MLRGAVPVGRQSLRREGCPPTPLTVQQATADDAEVIVVRRLHSSQALPAERDVLRNAVLMVDAIEVVGDARLSRARLPDERLFQRLCHNQLLGRRSGTVSTSEGAGRVPRP